MTKSKTEIGFVDRHIMRKGYSLGKYASDLQAENIRRRLT